MKHLPVVIAFITFLSAGHSVNAQITVQQPVIGQFGVNTTVSIPDGGWAHVGSVSRATSFRRQRGFFQPGSSIAPVRSHTGISAGVTIIDLAEMDRMILGYDPAILRSGRYGRSVVQTPQFQQRQIEQQEQQLAQQKAELRESRKPGLASGWFRLGQRAEEQGRLDRARDCYARAKSSGSKEAVQRLLALKKPAGVPAVAKTSATALGKTSATGVMTTRSANSAARSMVSPRAKGK